MAIQIILCVETKKSADTDTIYIMDTINRWYKIDNTTKLSKINMNSKTRYNSKDVVKEIAEKKRNYIHGETRGVYFIDTDKYESNQEHARELTLISTYCENHSYDLVWFCHDVEEVYLGYKVAASQKVREATVFRKKNRIQEIQEKQLSCKIKRVNTSNILDVLDKYLPRK